MSPVINFMEQMHLCGIIVNVCARLDDSQGWINKIESRLTELNITDSAKRIDFLSTRIRDDQFMRKLKDIYQYN